MNRTSGRLGWLRRLLRLGRGNAAYTSTPVSLMARRKDDGEEDGPGVPVPVGPRPRRGGAQAWPPVPEEDAQESRR